MVDFVTNFNSLFNMPIKTDVKPQHKIAETTRKYLTTIIIIFIVITIVFGLINYINLQMTEYKGQFSWVQFFTKSGNCKPNDPNYSNM
jgi:hypothetical protein